MKRVVTRALIVVAAILGIVFAHLGVLSDGRSMIAKSVSHEVTVLSVGDPSEAVSANTNRIKGDCVGTTLTLYVNDRKLIEVDDRELTSGGVGLAVESADVIFDNFRVRAPRQ
jgi:hypothetical protein